MGLKKPQDVELDPKIHGDHAIGPPFRPGVDRHPSRPGRPRDLVGRPGKRLLARNPSHHVPADETGPLPGLVHEIIRVLDPRRQGGAHRARCPDVFRKGPGVDSFDSGHTVLLHVVRQGHLGSPVARMLAELLYDEGFRVWAPGLHVRLVDPVVADQGVRHGHDLPLVRGVCQDLLVPGHARVEDHLSDGIPMRTEGPAMEYTAVLKGQHGLSPLLLRHAHLVFVHASSWGLKPREERIGVWIRYRSGTL